jgi:ribonuclease E
MDTLAPTQSDRAAPQASDTASSQDQGNVANTPTEGSEGRGKRTRDRYGRERGPRGDRTEQSAERLDQAVRDSQPQQDEPAEEPRRSYFATPAEAPQPSPVVAPAATMSAEVTPVTPAPITTAPVVVAAAPVAPTPVPAPAPVVVPTPVPAATGMPKLQSFDLPVAELAQVAQNSGLSWVNSNAEKIAAVQAAIAAEPKPVRVPRERPVAVKTEASPLVMVETKRDLREMTLPFEEKTPV